MKSKSQGQRLVRRGETSQDLLTQHDRSEKWSKNEWLTKNEMQVNEWPTKNEMQVNEWPTKNEMQVFIFTCSRFHNERNRRATNLSCRQGQNQRVTLRKFMVNFLNLFRLTKQATALTASIPGFKKIAFSETLSSVILESSE